MMVTAEHTDLDLEAFLLLSKCLSILALRVMHAADITVTCCNILVVVPVPCHGTSKAIMCMRITS